MEYGRAARFDQEASSAERRTNARLVSSQQGASLKSPEAQNQRQSDPEAGGCLVQERELAHSLYIGSIACLRLDQRRLARCKLRPVPGSLRRPVGVLQSTCLYSGHLGGDCTLGAAASIPKPPRLLGHKAPCVLRTVAAVTVEIPDIREWGTSHRLLPAQRRDFQYRKTPLPTTSVQ